MLWPWLYFLHIYLHDNAAQICVNSRLFFSVSFFFQINTVIDIDPTITFQSTTEVKVQALYSYALSFQCRYWNSNDQHISLTL